MTMFKSCIPFNRCHGGVYIGGCGGTYDLLHLSRSHAYNAHVGSVMRKLHCSTCNQHFACSEFGHCSYHPEDAKYSPGQNTGYGFVLLFMFPFVMFGIDMQCPSVLQMSRNPLRHKAKENHARKCWGLSGKGPCGRNFQSWQRGRHQFTGASYRNVSIQCRCLRWCVCTDGFATP